MSRGNSTLAGAPSPPSILLGYKVLSWRRKDEESCDSCPQKYSKALHVDEWSDLFSFAPGIKPGPIRRVQWCEEVVVRVSEQLHKFPQRQWTSGEVQAKSGHHLPGDESPGWGEMPSKVAFGVPLMPTFWFWSFDVQCWQWLPHLSRATFHSTASPLLPPESLVPQDRGRKCTQDLLCSLVKADQETEVKSIPLGVMGADGLGFFLLHLLLPPSLFVLFFPPFYSLSLFLTPWVFLFLFPSIFYCL